MAFASGGFHPFLLQGGDALIVPFELGQPLLGLVLKADDIRQRLAVLATQIVEQLSAFPDLGEALGILFQPLGEAAQVSPGIGRLRGKRL